MEDSKYEMDWRKAADGNHNIIMIGGGTGTGKASSILSFDAPTGEFVIWISLGSASLHADQYWKAFCNTLRRWSNVFAALDQKELPTAIKDISRFVTQINQAATRTGKAIVIVKNYHLLANCTVKNLLENIKVSCAVGVSTIFISDQYMEINSASSLMTSRRTDQIIAFTELEIKVYYTALNIVMNDEVLGKYYEITGGWVQAIILIGKYLPRGEALSQEDIDQAINQMYQYFHEEYHGPLEPHLQQNLILLSMLSGFTMEMALELTSLTVENYTKLYLDHFFCYNAGLNQTRFHKLYQKYLSGIRSEVPKKTQFAFLRKAAAWYDQHDMPMEAVTCYTGCKEYDSVIPVLQRRAIQGYTPDQSAQIVNCLGKIPPNYMDNHPLHRLYFIFAKYFAGEKEQALHMQRQLRTELEGRARGRAEDLVLGELYVSEAYQAWEDISIEYYQNMKIASDLLPCGSTLLDVDEYHSPPIGNILRFHSLQPGDLLQAKEICLNSAPYVKKVLPNIGNSFCYLAIAEVHLYRCEYEEAIRYANLAAAEGMRTKTWTIIAESSYVLQRIHMAIGDLDDILAYGQRVIEYYSLVQHNSLYSVERVTKFHENVYFGLYHLLDSFADANPLVNQNDVNYINLGRELYVHAIYKVFALRQYDPALTFIDEARQVSYTTGMFFARLKLLILKALVNAKMERPAVAAKSLLEAYRISHSNDILFSFIEFGEEILYLLDVVRPHIQNNELPEEWIARVLKGSKAYQHQRTHNTLEHLRRNPHIHPSKLIQLTKQEFNVLKHVAMGRTTQEVAQIMLVNQSTVYLYLSRAYKKLGVGRKEQAVQIAIAEGILD